MDGLLRIVRRAYRVAFPRLRHPVIDGVWPETQLDREYGEAYLRAIHLTDAAPDDFVTQRYVEGKRWRHLLSRYKAGGRVLDLGAGDGAIELAFAATSTWKSFSVEKEWNDTFRKIRDTTAAPIRRIIADAAQLPFRPDSFQAVTLLETIEHVHQPTSATAEIARVLDGAGVVLVTTPPRWRYAFRRDPHFGIRLLVLLPPTLQRSIARRYGYTRSDHYVGRIYGSTAQLSHIFAQFTVLEIVSRSRAPHRWFWDALVFRKQHKADPHRCHREVPGSRDLPP